MRVGEEVQAALLPVADVRHAGDDPLSGHGPDVGDAVQVAVRLVVLDAELVEDPLVHERRLAGPRRADDDHGLARRARQQRSHPRPVRLARHRARRREQLHREIGAERSEDAQPSRRPLLLLALRVRVEVVPDALLLGQIVEQRARTKRERDRAQQIAAVGPQRVEVVVVELGPRARQVRRELRRERRRVVHHQPVVLPRRVVRDRHPSVRRRQPRLQDDRAEPGGAPLAAATGERQLQPHALEARSALELEDGQRGRRRGLELATQVGDERLLQLRGHAPHATARERSDAHGGPVEQATALLLVDGHHDAGRRGRVRAHSSGSSCSPSSRQVSA